MKFLTWFSVFALLLGLLFNISCASNDGDDDTADPTADDDDNDTAIDDDVADDDATDDDTTDDDNDTVDDDTADDDDDSTPDEFGLMWIDIPSGAFEMGCSPQDILCEADEYPRHTINISAFFMTETEITQEQYEQVMGEHAESNDGKPLFPVETVTWDEGEAYCEAVGGHLPTEAQWEYGARAGTTTRFYCGTDPECLDAIAWYAENSNSASHAVKKKEPNTFGLYDMTGNVWEWVHDKYDAGYYRKSPDTDPTGPANGRFRIIRGGSLYDSDPTYLRVSYRPYDLPNIMYGNIGFRCAKE